MPFLVLASTSPRRRDLLALLGIPFTIDDPEFDEVVRSGHAPLAQAASFALGKAQSCAGRHADAVVVGSDTLIEVDGDPLGKPVDAADARAMLRRLQGRTHLIHTAVAVVRKARHLEAVEMETVRVAMRALTDAAIEEYVGSREYAGKAGGYSIQGIGGALIERIVGDFPAAVGLPLRLTGRLLQRAGLETPVDLDALYREKPYPNWAKFSP
jgi:septum formation protein